MLANPRPAMQDRRACQAEHIPIPRKWERRVPVSKVSIPLSSSYPESGTSVQRLFSTFADGWPGGGLLAQRLLTGGALVYCGVTCATVNPICGAVVPESIAAVAGVLLIAGAWTPIAGAVVGIVEASLAFLSPAHATFPLFLAVLGATLAMIGPGTWSLDAWLFGRKRIVPPDAYLPGSTARSPKGGTGNSNDGANSLLN